MSFSAIIGVTTVSVVQDSVHLADKINEQSDFSFSVIDLAGTATYTKNMPVAIADSITGDVFTGYINNQPSSTLLYPNPTRIWDIDCRDQTWLLNKKTSNKVYRNQFAGTIFTDLIQRYGAEEGLIVRAALRWDEMVTEWQQGTLANTVATTNASSGNVGGGDLELALAGAPLTITENTTAGFAAGTLTGCQAINNTLIPSATSAIKFQATLNSQVSDGDLYVMVWNSSHVIGSSDVFTYSVWVNNGSPSEQAGMDFVCTDGTTLRDSGLQDQNGLSVHPHTDISGFASNQWYTRTINLAGSGLVGKTIDYATVVFEFNKLAGTYSAFFRAATVGSATFFGTAATSTQLSPPQILKNTGYSSIAINVVQTYDAAAASRVSTSTSLNGVSVIRSSYIAFQASGPDGTGVNLSYSIDGGLSYLECTNQAALTAMLAGQSVASTSILLKETFFNTSGDPTQYATLNSVVVSFQPAYAATLAAPVSYAATTQTLWNAGTLSNTQANSGGDLSLIQSTRSWAMNGATFANQTLYGGNSPSQALSGAQFALSTGAASNSEVRSRLDFAGQWQNFTMEFDVYVDQANVRYGCAYRTTGWQNNDASWAYAVEISTTTIELRLGGNTSSGTPSSSSVALVTFAQTLALNSWYRFKVVVSGNSHMIFLDNVLYINATDSTWTAAGYVALRNRNNTLAAYTAKFEDFGICSVLSGTWISPSTSISSLVTSGLSVITWDESLTTNAASVINTVQTSVDGGSTYQTCTNGGQIPNIPPGTNVSGKSILVKVTLSTATAIAAPDIQQLVWRVIPAYAASGTKSTAPIGWDSMIRSNSTGNWGTATNGHTYSKVGTGTIGLTSDEATITSTTGDVLMVLGGTSAADQEASVRLKISVSGEIAGINLRYVDVNNLYRFAATDTGISLMKVAGGVSITLASVAMSISTGTWYWLRFRVVGSTTLYGRIWQDGSVEPSNWNITAIE